MSGECGEEADGTHLLFNGFRRNFEMAVAVIVVVELAPEIEKE